MRNKILSLLEQNAGLKHDQIAVMLDMSVEQVDKEIEEMTEEGILLRSKALINWEKTDREFVAAQIELKVTPQRGEGFDKIAERIYQYPEVKSVYLISGGFDIAVTIEGRTMKEVALFVAEKLSTMEHVTSTKTNFILKKYKQDGVLFAKEGKDERAVIS
ncbi:MAG: Lrp/AsnC family transcriptional regulator [Clostridia bacterium]|nr:Lrp/AsnC family transcriptional regulator [Clostridia bacterium]MBQ4543770.1 Lrp/AsnC family transcriptional regulator [Clostridia bacterium]